MLLTVILAFHILSIPLPYTRPTGICQHRRAHVFQYLLQAVPLDGRSDQLAARSH